MDIKEITKYPKRQLVKLAVDKGLITWEEGLKKSREFLLELLKNN